MKMQMLVSDRLEHVRSGTARSLGRWGRWAWQGLVEVGHNSLAIMGLASLGVVLLFSSDSSLRTQVERQALDWLNVRHAAPAPAATEEAADLLADLAEPSAVGRATATDPSALPREQARVVTWLSRRYRVAPEPVASLVQEAWAIGKKARLDPTLILAIIAIESSFNPFAQSPVGAQGLMQVMTRVHDEKYNAFGGRFAAFDPAANLRVGAQILTEYLGRAQGDMELALKYYVGAANLPDDGGYADRVLAEQAFLRAVASGQNVLWTASNTRPAPAPAAPGGGQPVQVATNAAVAKTVPAPAKAGTAAKGKPSGHMPESGTVMAPAIGAPVAANLSTATQGSPTAAVRPLAPADKPAAPPRQAASPTMAAPAQPTAQSNIAASTQPAALPTIAAPTQPAIANLPGIVPVSVPAGARPSSPAGSAPLPTEAKPAKPNTDTAMLDGRVALAEGGLR